MSNQKNRDFAFYNQLFQNYSDLLTVEEARKALGFRSQTSIIRRIHSNRIRHFKNGRAYMIPKRYFIEFVLREIDQK